MLIADAEVARSSSRLSATSPGRQSPRDRPEAPVNVSGGWVTPPGGGGRLRRSGVARRTMVAPEATPRQSEPGGLGTAQTARRASEGGARSDASDVGLSGLRRSVRGTAHADERVCPRRSAQSQISRSTSEKSTLPLLSWPPRCGATSADRRGRGGQNVTHPYLAATQDAAACPAFALCRPAPSAQVTEVRLGHATALVILAARRQ
jgi:hypothetical protein